MPLLSVSLKLEAKPHAPQHVIVLNEAMPECATDVDHDQRRELFCVNLRIVRASPDLDRQRT